MNNALALPVKPAVKNPPATPCGAALPPFTRGAEGQSETGPWGRALMDWLPENYPASGETITFQEALQPEVDALWRLRNEMLEQMDPYSATWGLPYWEDSLGLTGCEGLTLDTRRRQVVAKLQGRGPTTVQVVKDLAQTMLGCAVEVIEHYSQYTIELEPDSGGKLPPGARQLRERLIEILPAHLDWQMVIHLFPDDCFRFAVGPRCSGTQLPKMGRDMPGKYISVSSAAGPRCSLSPLEARVHPMPPGMLHCAVRVGGPISRTELPVYVRS